MQPHNLGNRFRQKRMRRFLELVRPLRSRTIRILDLGGTAAYWHALPALYGDERVEITIVNLGDREFDDRNLRVRQGDARELPQFADGAFDVVHSNSVIEHVGRWEDMRRMAAEVRRLAPRYFVQTPNYWFPIEPHYKLPFVQFLPEEVRGIVVELLHRNPTSGPVMDIVRGTRLLTRNKMAELFPDSEIEYERFGAMTKSLMAVRR